MKASGDRRHHERFGVPTQVFASASGRDCVPRRYATSKGTVSRVHVARARVAPSLSQLAVLLAPLIVAAGCEGVTALDASTPLGRDASPAVAPSVSSGPFPTASNPCLQTLITTYSADGPRTTRAWLPGSIDHPEEGRRQLRFRAFVPVRSEAATPDLLFSAGTGFFRVLEEAGNASADNLSWFESFRTGTDLYFALRVRSADDNGRALAPDALWFDDATIAGLFGTQIRELRSDRLSWTAPVTPLRADVEPAVPFRPVQISVFATDFPLVAYTRAGDFLFELDRTSVFTRLRFNGAEIPGLTSPRWCAGVEPRAVPPVVRGSVATALARLPEDLGPIPTRSIALLWLAGPGDGTAAPQLAHFVGSADGTGYCIERPIPFQRPEPDNPAAWEEVDQPVAMTLVDDTLVILADGDGSCD